LLFLRLRENRWTKVLERTLRETPPGGVLLAEPLPRSMSEVPRIAAKIREACYGPVFIAMRQEGGDRDPLSRYFPALPSPGIVATHGSEVVGHMAELIGEAMRRLGINTNFAPCLDLKSDCSLSASGFGRDSALTGACGESFVQGLARHGILPCAKHFPGEGSVPPEQAGQLPVSAKPMAALWREDLAPFRRVLPQLPMLLVSAAAFKAYDFDMPKPASLSSAVVGGLLRTKLGYRGLALAYDLEAWRVRGPLGFAEAVVQSLVAGCDIVIVDQGSLWDVAVGAIRAAFDTERVPESRFTESLGRWAAAVKQAPPLPRKISVRVEQDLRRRFRLFAEEFGHA
jgi:beta-N-acetylhexosaminidase